MANNKDYWKERFTILEAAQLNKGVEYYEDIERQYKLAMASVEKDITAWYSRIADNNGITYHGAKKLLNKNELKEFRWTVEEYLKYGEENALSSKWIKELENASAKFHITRLESIKLQTQQQIEVLYGNQQDGLDKLIRGIYVDGYYNAAFAIQQGLGVGWSLMAVDEDKISKIISKPWTVDGKTFSDRIWNNKSALVDTVHTQITQMAIRGDAPDKAIKAIAKQFGVKKSQAGNLVMTETAFFSSAANRDCFNNLDVEKFEVVSTLDNCTCEKCGALDGIPILMKDFESGVTASPFHPKCRCTECPYFDDEFTAGDTRAARDPITGKSISVPGSMKFPEWKEKYITNDPTAILEQKKLRNLSDDETQYKKYKDVLGETMQYGFAGFQNLKYNNINGWNDLSGKYTDQKIRNKLKSDTVNKTIDVGKQGKHIIGHNNYIDGRSYLTVTAEEAQSLVNTYAGTGLIEKDRLGRFTNKELIVSDNTVGVNINNETGIITDTDRFYIHYGKNGTHIVPTLKGLNKID